MVCFFVVLIVCISLFDYFVAWLSSFGFACLDVVLRCCFLLDSLLVFVVVLCCSLFVLFVVVIVVVVCFPFGCGVVVHLF